MKQVLQNVDTGKTVLETAPSPLTLQDIRVRVLTVVSLTSAETEKMVIDLAQKSYLGKPKARPGLVKQVLNKFKIEG